MDEERAVPRKSAAPAGHHSIGTGTIRALFHSLHHFEELVGP
jgi:hypothetical protein